MQINATSKTRMTLDVTDEERAIALEVKRDFKVVMKKIEVALRVITDLRDAIVKQHPTQDQLKNNYSGRLLRFRKKIRDTFNDCLNTTKTSLEKLSGIVDPDMLRLREILVAEIGEFSDGAESILSLIGDVEREGFTKSLEAITAQMEKRQKSINDVIESQLFGHLESDILGKLRLGDLHFRICKRARVIRQLVRFAGEKEKLDLLVKSIPKIAETMINKANGLVFIPHLVKEVAKEYGIKTAKAAVHEAGVRNLIELRPESGMKQLSKEDKELCLPFAFDPNVVLSWARIIKGKENV